MNSLFGVLVRTTGKFKADLRFNGKSIYLGVFSTPEAAARAFDEGKRSRTERPLRAGEVNFASGAEVKAQVQYDGGFLGPTRSDVSAVEELYGTTKPSETAALLASFDAKQWKGVSLQCGWFTAQICISSKHRHLGLFSTPAAAAHLYDDIKQRNAHLMKSRYTQANQFNYPS